MKAAKFAVASGLLIGFVNLVWLYLAYFLGLHTSGLAVFQGFMLIWLAVNIAACIVALKSLRQAAGGLSYWGGVQAGALAAIASAVVAVIGQIGYFKVIHPEWPEYMVEQTRQ